MIPRLWLESIDAPEREGDMSVAVGVISGTRHIVLTSDTKVSFGEMFSADNTALKGKRIHERWILMFAAKYTDLVPSLIRRIETKCPENWKSELSLDDMTTILRTAYQAERKERAIEAHVIPLGLSWDEFRANGPNELGTSDYAVVRQSIADYQLGVELLVAGHVKGQRNKNYFPHILTVRDPGIVYEHGIIGYAAIGSGGSNAISMLASRQQNPRLGLEPTMFHACEAKFAAESALGVGEVTVAIIMSPDAQNMLEVVEGPAIKPIRKEWERVGKPRRPSQRSLKFISDVLDPARSRGMPGTSRSRDALPKPSGSATKQEA